MGLLKPIIVTFISIVLLALLVHSITYASWATLIIASLVLTLLQKIVRPVLKILFLPINIITLGLFSLVINVIILWLAILIVPGFHVDQTTIGGLHLAGFWSLLFVSFVLGILQSVVGLVL